MKSLVAAGVAIVRAVPEAWVGPMARLLRAIVFGVFRYRRRVIAENLAQAFPALPVAERRRLAHAASLHLCLTLLETLRVGCAPAAVRGLGLEAVDAAIEGKRGLIVVGAHTGSFELAAGTAYGRYRGRVRAALVVKDFPPAFDRVLTRLREATGLELIRGDEGGAARAILKLLREGQAVVFVLDQNATRKQGVFVDFFGRPASTMVAPAVFAARTGAPVLLASVWREAPGQHVLELTPFTEAPPEGEDPVAWRTAAWTRHIERQIRAHPEQWMWTHKRWRTRPVEERGD